MDNFDKIILTHKERFLLFTLRIQKKRKKDILKPPYRQLHLHSLISPNYLPEHGPEGESIPDGTFSLTNNYKRYCIYRREQFFKGKLPVIIALLALLKSYGFGIDDFIFWCMQQLKQ